MKKFSEDELKTLYQWIKRKEIRADQKYWEQIGANLPLTEKNCIIKDNSKEVG